MSYAMALTDHLFHGFVMHYTNLSNSFSNLLYRMAQELKCSVTLKKK